MAAAPAEDAGGVRAAAPHELGEFDHVRTSEASARIRQPINSPDADGRGHAAGFAFGISAFAAALGLSTTAQAYPTKPVRFLVGFAAGGPTDILARSVANAMSKELSEQIIVENRPGA
jgi:hypothetical protein